MKKRKSLLSLQDGETIEKVASHQKSNLLLPQPLSSLPLPAPNLSEAPPPLKKQRHLLGAEDKYSSHDFYFHQQQQRNEQKCGNGIAYDDDDDDYDDDDHDGDSNDWVGNLSGILLSDILLLIFYYCDGKVLNVCRRVCKQWYMVQHDEVFRKEHCQNHLKVPHQTTLAHLRHEYNMFLGLKTGRSRQFNSLGRTLVECWYLNGVKHGPYRRWNAKKFFLEKFCHYKNDKLDGEMKKWYDANHLKLHCFFKQGKLHGRFTSYDKTKVCNKGCLPSQKEYCHHQHHHHHQHTGPSQHSYFLSLQIDYSNGKIHGMRKQYQKKNCPCTSKVINQINHHSEDSHLCNSNNPCSTIEKMPHCYDDNNNNVNNNNNNNNNDNNGKYSATNEFLHSKSSGQSIVDADLVALEHYHFGKRHGKCYYYFRDHPSQLKKEIVFDNNILLESFEYYKSGSLYRHSCGSKGGKTKIEYFST